MGDHHQAHVSLRNRFVVESLLNADGKRIKVIQKRDKTMGIYMIGIVVLPTRTRGPDALRDLVNNWICVEPFANSDSRALSVFFRA